MLTVEINDAITATVQDTMLNVHNAQGIFRQLEDLVQQHHKDLVLNLVNVTSCDSSTIALFVELQSSLKDRHRKLRLANVAPFVLKVFEMLHITKFFNIE
jgi:anti-anti-sigma factor